MPRAADGDSRKNIDIRKSRRSRAAKNLQENELELDAAQKVPNPRTQEQLPSAPVEGDIAGFSEIPQTQNTTHVVLRGKRFFGTKNGWCLFESYYQEYANGANAPDNRDGYNFPSARQGFESLVNPREFKNHVWYTMLLETFRGTLHVVAHPIQSLKLIATHVTTWWKLMR
jgi:hypothetical protein